MCDSGVYLRKIIHMIFFGQVSGLVENYNTEIYSDTINVIKVELCAMVLVLFIELFLFITLSVTLTLFQGHSHFDQF